MRYNTAQRYFESVEAELAKYSHCMLDHTKQGANKHTVKVQAHSREDSTSIHSGDLKKGCQLLKWSLKRTYPVTVLKVVPAN